MVKVIATSYTKPNEFGDFKWMLQQDKYANVLFIFNDDVESKGKFCVSKGNAVIRPFNRRNPAVKIPRSAGIPTGFRRSGGFTKLNDEVRGYIDDAIEDMKNVVKTHGYEIVMFSQGKDSNIGTGMFKVHEDVLIYITEKISLLNAI